MFEHIFENAPVQPMEFDGDEKAFVQWQVDTYNKRQGKLTGYNCPLCKNRGDFARVDENCNEVHYFCSCMKIRKSMALLNKSGLSDEIEEKTLDKFKCNAEWQWYLKQKSEAYLTEEKPYWLYFGGQSGCGKTHLCTAICGKLLKNCHEVRYVQWKKLLQKLQALQFDVSYENTMHELQTVEVLYIDDFLQTPTNERTHRPERPKDTALGYAFELINSRVISGKKTIISSEHYFDEIEKYDEALAGRIQEHAGKGKYIMNISASPDRNYRKQVQTI